MKRLADRGKGERGSFRGQCLVDSPAQHFISFASQQLVVRGRDLVISTVGIEHEENLSDRGEQGVLLLGLFLRDRARMLLFANRQRKLDVRFLELARLFLQLVLLFQHLVSLQHESATNSVDDEKKEQELTEHRHRGHHADIVLLREESAVHGILSKNEQRQSVSQHLEPRPLEAAHRRAG